LSIITLTNLLKDTEPDQHKKHHNAIWKKYFKPYLLENSEICSDFIAKKDKEELQNSPNQIQVENEQIYDIIINHLDKQENPIKLHIDETQPFALPICTQVDFEERYASLLLFIGAHWQISNL
jgi:hypothetical protein